MCGQDTLCGIAKGTYCWNSSQDILPIEWKVWIYRNILQTTSPSVFSLMEITVLWFEFPSSFFQRIRLTIKSVFAWWHKAITRNNADPGI